MKNKIPIIRNIILIVIWLALLSASEVTATTVMYSTSPLVGKGKGQSSYFDGDLQVNPMTRGQTFVTQLLSLKGRSGLDLSIGLSFQNNFWVMPDDFRGGPDYIFNPRCLDTITENCYTIKEQMFDVSRNAFSSDITFGQYIDTLIPPNNIGGWSLASPASSRLMLIAKPMINITGSVNCYIASFGYTSPDGTVLSFIPGIGTEKKLIDHCVFNGKAVAENFVGTEFYSERGDGSKMIITGETRLVHIEGVYPYSDSEDPVIRMIDTNGNSFEFVMLPSVGSLSRLSYAMPNAFNGNYILPKPFFVIAEGIPQKIKDIFGNSILVNFQLSCDNNANLKIGSATMIDTTGREVTLSYDPKYQFPSQITARNFYPDGTDMTISFDFQAMHFDDPEIASCIDWKYSKFSYASTSSFDFATIKKINMPNNMRWQFNYDRGLGTKLIHTRFGNLQAIVSDGSITELRTPYGKLVRYGVGGYIDSGTSHYTTQNYYTDLTFWLDPNNFGAFSNCVKLGYVNNVTTYDSNGDVELKIKYFTEINDRKNLTTVIDFYDKDNNLEKTERHSYENKDVSFVERETLIYDKSRLLQSTNRNYECYGGYNYFNGYCVLTEETIQKDEAVTRKTFLYDKSIVRTFMDKGYWLGLIVPKIEQVVARPSQTTIYDKVNGEYIPIATEKTTYENSQIYLDNNLINLPKTQQTFDGKGKQWSSSEIRYDTVPVVPIDGSLKNFEPSQKTVYALPTESIIYDPQGKLKPIVSKIIYNEAGQVVKTVNPRGFATIIEYDPQMGCSGAYPTKTTDALGHETRMEYDCKSGINTKAIDSNGLVSSIEYNDPLLRSTKAVNPDGTYQITLYDDINRKQTVQIYSSNGNMKMKSINYFDGTGRTIKTETTNPNGQSAENVVLLTEYDSLGRSYKSTNPNGYETVTSFDALNKPVKTTIPTGSIISYSYDGRITRTADIYGREKETESDILGRLVRVTAEDGLTTRYDYDLSGNLIHVIQPSGQERFFTYDGYGRQITASMPEKTGIYSINSYDQNGNVLSETTANSYIITNTYDELDRLITTNFQGPVQTESQRYEYDKAANGIGQLSKFSEGNNSRLFSYDSKGRISKEIIKTGQNNFSIGYLYNEFGSIDSLTLPSGRVIKYNYNNAGNLQSLDGIKDLKTTNFLRINQYAKTGAIESQTYGNGLSENFAYDPKNLYVISHSAGNLLSFDYSYYSSPAKCDGSGSFGSASGTIMGSIYEKIGETNRHLTFTYDCLDRLKEAQATGTSSWKLTYEFDNKYNRVSQQGVSSINQNMIFDDQNHIQGYIYDNNGNVVDDGKTRYIYDGANRLISSITDGNETQYAYIGDQRISKQEGNESTYYIRDANDNLLSEYAYSKKSTISEQTNYYLKDHLGSIRAIANESGEIVSVRNFYPYGEEETHSADNVTKKFTGQERDPQTGNDYMKARYYASTAGVFLSVDTGKPDMLNPQTWNRYSYVNNNPLLYIDPVGKAGIIARGVPGGQSILDAKREYDQSMGLAKIWAGIKLAFASDVGLQPAAMAYEGPNTGSKVVAKFLSWIRGGESSAEAASQLSKSAKIIRINELADKIDSSITSTTGRFEFVNAPSMTLQDNYEARKAFKNALYSILKLAKSGKKELTLNELMRFNEKLRPDTSYELLGIRGIHNELEVTGAGVRFSAAKDVPQLLNDWYELIDLSREFSTAEELGLIAQEYLIKIHPFSNANNRMAKLVYTFYSNTVTK